MRAPGGVETEAGEGGRGKLPEGLEVREGGVAAPGRRGAHEGPQEPEEQAPHRLERGAEEGKGFRGPR